MIVTRIERQKRHPERVSVFLDGTYAIGLQADTAERFHIRTGEEVDAGMLDRLRKEEEYALARRQALRLLSYKMRTERELRGRLREKEHPPATIDRVIEDLRAAGLVDDAAYARAFISDMRKRRPSGRTLLRFQLRRRGVAPTTADEELSRLLDHELEEADALAAARKYLRRAMRSRRKEEADRRRQRLVRYLMGRGFRWPAISAVLKRSSPAEPAPDPGD